VARDPRNAPEEFDTRAPSQRIRPHHEIARQRLELRQIFAAHSTISRMPLLPADLRFPTDIALDGGAIEQYRES